MPAFGGSIRSPRLAMSWRTMASAGVGLAAAGLLLCALVVGQTMYAPTTGELASSGGDTLASMQGQVQRQLVEAAKRHAMAEKHTTESVKLANAAQQEREQAALLKKRATLAKSEAELEHASDEVKLAHSKVRELRGESETLLATVRRDKSKADGDKEQVMELEDKAGALSEKASEEQDKIEVVQSKQSKAAQALPKLLKDAEQEEIEASEMKAQARKRMADSQRKASAAKRLDTLAQEKEHEAHVMRNKLMGILEQKTNILKQKEKDAAFADDLAKKAAQVEADKAQEYAAEAAEKAQLAKTQAAQAPETAKEAPAAEEETPGQKLRDARVAKEEADADAADAADDADAAAEETPVQKVRSEKADAADDADSDEDAAEQETPGQKLRSERAAKAWADAEAADAADDTDADEADKMRPEVQKAATQTLHLVAPRDPMQANLEGPHPSREEVQAARAINLQRAALEAERRAGAQRGREQQLADVSKTVDGSEVAENEDGRLVMNKRVAVSSAMKEDGHYSEREDSFKRALAAAYRSGYQGKYRQAALRAQSSVKPARMQMLGDATAAGSDGLFTAKPGELLSAGPGSTVQLEKESANAPVFSMLWTDPGSLKADTEDLMGTTSRLHRYAPNGRGGPSSLPEVSTQYEGGHASREENAFKNDMGKYRSALKEEREAHEEKVKRLDQELAQLPAAGKNTGNWKQDREASYSAMLKQPQNHWNAHGQHTYSHTQQAALMAMPSVHENEEGHLVFARRRRARMQELHEYAGRRVRFQRGDDGAGERQDTVRRVREELARERRRDRRLEDVTQRLQGEIDELRQNPSAGARTEDLAQMRRQGEQREEREPREERRRRVEGARGRIQRYHARAHGGHGGHGGQGGQGQNAAKFHPDNTYNKEYAMDPGHVSVGEIKFQHALKDFDRTKSILREGAQEDQQNFHMPQLVPSHLPGQGL